MIEIFYEDTEDLDLSPDFFVLWLSNVTKAEGCILGDITLIFCSDEYLIEMNRKFLNHDYYTDIITFDYSDADIVSGDLFISIDRVRENATQNEELFHVELNRVVGHGTLHLLGYNDKSKEEQNQMTAKENWALGLIVPRET